MTVKPEKAQQNGASNERWPFDGSETGVAVILAEVSRNDSILQSYRDQFLVAETFTAAIAASAIFTTPNIAFFVAVFGIPFLIGLGTGLRGPAKAFDYWGDTMG